MVGRRQIDSRALSALRQREPDTRPPVREERLKTGDGLVAWRGNSGKRYVFKIDDPETCAPPPANAVMAAVSREGGVPLLIDVSVAMEAEDFMDWRRDAVESGASEIQVHVLCDDADAASALVRDLGFEIRATRCYGLGF